VETARVIQSLGLGLDEKAVEAVKQWHFKPAIANGEPVKFAESAEVLYSLNAAPSWRIMGASYRVSQAAGTNQVSNPVLSEYTKPDERSCNGAGATARVSLEVGGDGRPVNVQLVEGEGDPAGEAVRQAIWLWRFQPALLNGQPVAGKANFELQCGAYNPPDPSIAPERVGKGVSAPTALYQIEPEYSEEARKAKLQGEVLLYLEIDQFGRTGDIRVARPLGLGLDEKAMEAVSQWRFKPALKGSVPVKVSVNLETNFRLL
jgi:TonB family protein